jgi:hypothetical protein
MSDFLLKYHQNPPGPQETEQRKKGKNREDEKEKHQESFQIKGKLIF